MGGGLTQACGVERGVALALPLPAAVTHAQTLQQVSTGVRLGPRISNSV